MFLVENCENLVVPSNEIHVETEKVMAKAIENGFGSDYCHYFLQLQENYSLCKNVNCHLDYSSKKPTLF